jgi:hypothetical protein
MGRNSNTNDPVQATVTSGDLAAAGLIPPLEDEGTALDKVQDSGQAGERINVVTNYPVDNAEQAKRIAIGILKRNLDENLDETVTGNLVNRGEGLRGCPYCRRRKHKVVTRRVVREAVRFPR